MTTVLACSPSVRTEAEAQAPCPGLHLHQVAGLLPLALSTSFAAGPQAALSSLRRPAAGAAGQAVRTDPPWDLPNQLWGPILRFQGGCSPLWGSAPLRFREDSSTTGEI